MTLRVRCPDRSGGLARVLEAIARAEAPLGDIRIVAADSQTKTRDIGVFCVDREHLDRVVSEISAVPNAEAIRVVDEVLEMHRGGPIRTTLTVPLETVMDLRMLYTPGVAMVCDLIKKDPAAAWEYTTKGNKIAIVTNGTAVLGLGDIGPLAGLPVMEGKSAIMARYVGVSAEPILIDSKDPEEIINIVSKISSSYGAIQLEDIAAPACFEIEDRLSKMLDIPVFHDDQHGTATVCIAGLINALKATNRTAGDCSSLVLGGGAAGLAIAQFLLKFGVGDVLVCDSHGAMAPGREVGMNPYKEKVAQLTNPKGVTGSLEEVIKGRNLFIGVSRPNLVSQDMVRSMGADGIVFALANPVSEISAEDAIEAGAAVALDGRGMNNALAYPGLFRGALDARASTITHEMKLAAAGALASQATDGALLPEMTDEAVHMAVASAVAQAWSSKTGRD